MCMFNIVLILFPSRLRVPFSGRDNLVSELTRFEYLGAMGDFFGLIAFRVVHMLLLSYSLLAFIVKVIYVKVL